VSQHAAGVLKTNHKYSPKLEVKKIMKDWPVGSHLVLEGRKDAVDIIFVGYKYNKRKVINFMFTKGAGSTKCMGFYLAKWKDCNGNTQERQIPRPEIIH